MALKKPEIVELHQANVVLQLANVVMFSKDTSIKYRNATGMTNSAGVAEMRTYDFSGVPAGYYKVMIKKTVLEGAKEYVDEFGTSQVSGGKDYNLVNRKYQDEKTTDLEIKITPGNNRGVLKTKTKFKSVKNIIGRTRKFSRKKRFLLTSGIVFDIFKSLSITIHCFAALSAVNVARLFQRNLIK